VDNWDGWRRIVIPLRDPVKTKGSFDPSQVVSVRVRFINAELGQVWYLDQTVVDVGQWAKTEVYVPDTLLNATESIQVYAWDGAEWLSFLRWNGGADSGIVTAPQNLYFLDGTTAKEIFAVADWVPKGMATYVSGLRGETKDRIGGDTDAGTITYSFFYGCKKRIGFAIKMPPDDGQDSSTDGISQSKLKLEARYGQVLNYQDKKWIVDSGSAYIKNDTLHLTGTQTSRKAGGGLRFDQAFHSGKITTKFKVTSWGASGDGVGVGFRGGDPDNEYVVLFRADGWIELKIIASGIEYAPQMRKHSIALDTVYTLEIEETKPNVYSVRLDGSELFTFDMRSEIIQVGHYSLYSSGTTETEFQEFSVTSNNETITDTFARPWGLATYEFEDSTNTYYGLQNINDDWIALFDMSTNKMVALYTKNVGNTPSKLTAQADENEVYRELVIEWPTPVSVFLGDVLWSDLSIDADADGVPDVFENLIIHLAELVTKDEDWPA